MKTKFITLAIIILSGFVFAACENEDLVKPTVVIAEPTTDELVAAGTEMHIEADLADNVQLASYKINIHSAFDGHTHSSVAMKASQERQDASPFSFLQTYNDAKGQKNHHVHVHVDIPVDVATGEYHLIITVLDAAGNESSAATEFIIVEANATN